MKQQARINDYKRNEILTASPGRLIVMMYDGAIKRMGEALTAFSIKEEPERFQAINNHLLAAQNIITELTISLDMEKGGEIAQNCFRIYEYFNDRLIEANMKKDPAPIQQVKDMMADLREAWDTIVRKEETAQRDNRENIAFQA